MNGIFSNIFCFIRWWCLRRDIHEKKMFFFDFKILNLPKCLQHCAFFICLTTEMILVSKGHGQKSWIFPHAGNDIKWKYMPSRSRIWCPFVYIWSFFYRCFPAPNTYVWALDLGTPPWETPIKKGSDIDKRTSDSWSTRHVLSFYIISSVRKNPWFLTTSFQLDLITFS